MKSIAQTKVIFGCLMIFMNCQSGFGQQVMTLDSVLSLVETQHPDLISIREKIQALDAYAEGAKAWAAPEVDAGTWMTPYNRSEYPNMGSFMIRAEQKIPGPGKIRAKTRYMEAISAVETEDLEFMANILRAKAKENYYDLLILQKKKKLLQENLDLVSFMLKSAKLKYPYDQSKLQYIYKAEADLAMVKNRIVSLESGITVKKIMLNTLMNRKGKSTFTPDTLMTLPGIPTLSLDSSQITANRSDIAAINKEIEVRHLNETLEKTKARPDFGVTTGHMFGYGGNPNQFTLMGTISIPIAPWASQEYKSNIKGLKHDISALQRKKEAILDEAEGNIASLITQIERNKKQLKLYHEEIIPAFEKSYKTSLLAYEENTEELFVVLEQWQELLNVELQRLDLMNELLILQTEYEKELEIR